MPIYVYKGLETGNYYEFEQGFHDEPLKAHPETGEPLKRVITPPAIIFKGSGWQMGQRTSSSICATSASRLMAASQK